jgi:glutamate synthase (NADPH/NADH) large chain
VFPSLVNYEMVALEPLDADDMQLLIDVVTRHRDETGSAVAGRLLDAWDEALLAFHKVMPKDFKRVLEVLRQAEEENLPESETLVRVMAASHG